MSTATESGAVEILRATYQGVCRAIDGGRLVRAALGSGQADLSRPPTAVLAAGKASIPMLSGLLAHLDAARIKAPRGLLVVPATRASGSSDAVWPVGLELFVADHPHPTERSVTAARAARAMIESLGPSDRLLVLLSGGASALLTLPADPLTLADKRAALTAVARAGATITELNTVRKHLSAIKGGRLALACRAPVTVLALSDVIGNDPGTIASGPFSSDASTFVQALDLVGRLAPEAPASVFDRLKRGAKGELPETPKPGDPRLSHIDHRIVAGPDDVRKAAEETITSRGITTGQLWRNSEDSVAQLAAHCAERVAENGHAPRVLVGNGEPSVVVAGSGIGGRATHLALLVARAIAGRAGVAFLAAGTDDRDGGGRSNGAVVDGNTWPRALDAGLEPQRALDESNSEAPLAALGLLVQGPGTSNLLDLHLLATGWG